jgi:nitric oxide reductase large subunit
MKEICNRYGLTDEEAKIVDQILEEWKNLLGQMDAKVAVALKKIGDNPNREKIMEALLCINIEFCQKSFNPDHNL